MHPLIERVECSALRDI